MSRVTLGDLSLGGVKLAPSLARLREAYFAASPQLCTERAAWVTRLSEEAGLFGVERIGILQKARVYRGVLERKEPIVRHRVAYRHQGGTWARFEVEDCSPFAGSTTSKFKGVPLYPEFMALALWPELHTLPQRAQNPYYLSDADRELLNHEVFPRWMEDNLVELARARGTEQDRRRLQLLQKFVFFLASKPECVSHTIPDFSRAVREGLGAVIADARARRAGARGSAAEFYEGVGEVLQGILTYAGRLADKAAELARRERDAVKRAELEEISEIYRHVPEHPARSFREGLTSVWICWVACHLENANVGLSLGRLDQLLYDLYRRDVEAGRLTVSDAVQWVAHLWLKLGDHVPAIPAAGEQLFGGTGSNQAITLGGVDAAGEDAVNDLTYVMLRATELMQLRDPNLNARFHPDVHGQGAGLGYLRRLCEVNLETGATPALHNDRAVIQALRASGDSLEQARDYGVIGCVEPGSNGRYYGHSGAILLNLPSALELALFNGRHRHFEPDDSVISLETGEPSQFASFEAFKVALERQLSWVLEQAIAVNELLGRTHQAFYPTPILSALFEGPMQSGQDLVEGGALLNASGIAVIGLADVADSLNALETWVFREKALSFTDFLALLRADYQAGGQETWLRRLRDPKLTPRFGNDEPAAQQNANWLVQRLHDLITPRRNYRGGYYRVGYWTMTNHAGFGRLIGATPNGRRATESFASGLTPVSGVTPELTATLNSVADLPVLAVNNGMAVNLKFTPALEPTDPAARERTLEHFMAAVRGYFDRGLEQGRAGGMELQFNVTSRAKFLAAIRDPSQYPELLVRVSGYTAYFRDLNPQMQQEILDRTEYALATGHAVPSDPLELGGGRRS